MMKKILSLIISVLLLFGLFGFVGCETQTPTTPQDTSVSKIDPKLSSLKCGFSCLDELRFFEYLGNFYKAEVNTDKQYITEGDASGKFSFSTSPIDVPEFRVWADTKFFGEADFTKVQAITVEVFNPSETTHPLWMSFATSTSGAMTNFQTYPETKYTLEKGYNLIVLTLDRASADYLCDMKNVAYIAFRFANADEPYDLYFDNLRIHYTEEKIETAEKTYQENELLFFDDSMDIFFVQAMAIMCAPNQLPTVSLCRDPKYIKSGTGSLMIELSSADTADVYPLVGISGEAIERIDFSQYSKIRFTVYANHNNWMSVRFSDQNGVYCYAPTWSDPFVDGVGQVREIDIANLADQGLDVSRLATMEFAYGHVQNTTGQAFFIDEIILVK